jgi:hypothetical protein
MKRLLLLVPILVLLLLPIGCGGIQGIIDRMASDMIGKVTGEFTIKVGGTDGLNFTGEYEVWFLHYDPDDEKVVYTKDTYTVEGQVPEEYAFEGNAVAVIFQKQSDDYEELSVDIWMDEELVAWRWTTYPWGAVWVCGGMTY